MPAAFASWAEAAPDAPPNDLPYNNEIEQALLGALLSNNRAFDTVSDALDPKHFADPVHGRIFGAIAKLIGRDQRASAVTLKNYFDNDGALQDIGGAQYLARLSSSVVSFIGVADYARHIITLWTRRELITVAHDIEADAYQPDLDSTPAQLVERAEQRLYQVARSAERDGAVSLAKSASETLAVIEGNYKRGGALRGITTGISDLDRMLGGLIPGRLYLLGGRPSMGKTALALGIAFDTARSGNGVGFFSLEMPHADLTSRLLARMTGIATDKLDSGQIDMLHFEQIIETANDIGTLPIYIDDTGSLSLLQLRQRARRMVRKHAIKLLVVDYLQIMAGSPDAERRGRVDVVTQLTQGLKAIAKELNLPVLLLSQLSRKVEEREDKRPLLSDLRESGSIEQDADVVMFVYRQDYYLERSEPVQGANEKDEAFADRAESHRRRINQVKGIAEILVPKVRQGRVGTVRCHFDLTRQKFTQTTWLDGDQTDR